MTLSEPSGDRSVQCAWRAHAHTIGENRGPEGGLPGAEARLWPSRCPGACGALKRSELSCATPCWWGTAFGGLSMFSPCSLRWWDYFPCSRAGPPETLSSKPEKIVPCLFLPLFL